MKFKAFLKSYYPALLILLVLTAFSFYAYQEANRAITERRSKLFELRVQQVVNTVNDRIGAYAQILEGCQALFYASDSVTEDNWKAYVQNLNVSSSSPSFQALAYCTYIPRNEKDELERSIRESGHSGFNIKSSFRNKYLAPIIYIEPFSGRNLRAFGYDMYDEAIRRKAMNRAMVTGEAALTNKVILVQETNKGVQPGFLLYLPVYKDPEGIKTGGGRGQIKGFVYNAFRAHDLIGSVLKEFQDVNVEIYDGTEPNLDDLLFNSDSVLVQAKNSGDLRPEFTADTSVKVAGTDWTLLVSSKGEFGSTVERQQPVIVLILGIAITLLLFIASITLIKRRSEVLAELNFIKQLEIKKDEFIGIASHELKTPLTSIKAYMQFLERSNLNERDRVFLQKANSQIRKLSNLISDLLDVSKIQAGRLQIKVSSFLLKDLINDSVEAVQHMYSTHEIVKPASIPMVVLEGDKFRLEQAITNFLVNAVKYSPGAKKVYVETIVSNNMVKIEVRDTGIGISEANQKKMFEKFFRAEELSPTLAGLGMGLYISKEIVKLHDGEIEVKSELGKGSVFGIWLHIKEVIILNQ